MYTYIYDYKPNHYTQKYIYLYEYQYGYIDI